MAEVLIYRLEFISNNPTGSYVTGDIVDILVETDDVVLGNSTSGIVVKKNSVVISSGNSIGIYSSDPPFVQSNYNPQVCVSGALLVFNRGIFFPYGYFSSLADHPSCAVAPETCDLIVVGSPVLVRPTGDLVADGSITINATSSNPILYKLGSDFDYSDGTGQVSSTFAGLIPGTYRIYLRDSDNCGVNVFINLTVNNDYGVKYRAEYDDEVGGVTRIDILERAYLGAIIEVCQSGDPLQITMRGDGTTDKFEPVLAVELAIQLLSETDQQFLTIYTNDREQYRVKTYKNSDLKLYGKVLPQQYQEDYKAAPYYVSFSATCGLPQLKEYVLVQDDGQILFGTISLIKLVAYCLSRLNLDLSIRVACNMYATTMDQTAADDPFDQAYIDFECFYLSGEDPTLDFVLRSILEPFGARIVQWEGRWNIVRVEEMVGPYDYRDFDSLGDYVTNGTFDPVINLNYPSSITGAVVFAEANQNLEVKPGYGLLKVIYKLGLKPNILKNGDFRLIATYNESTNQYYFAINKDGFLLVNGGYSIAELYEIIDTDDDEEQNVAYLLQGGSASEPLTGSAYLKSDTYTIRMGTNNQLKISIRFKLPVVAVIAGSTAYYANLPYIKVRLVIQCGPGYLRNDGTWQLDPTEVLFYVTEYGEYVEKELTAQQPAGFTGISTTGLPFTVSVYQAYAFHADFTTLATFKALETQFLGEQTRKTFRTDDYYTTEVYPDKLLYYELEENTDAEDVPNIIRPDDYLNDDGDPDHNPKQWILKNKISVTPYANNDVQFWIDIIKVQFLTDGKDPIDAILRSKNGEAKNAEVYEKELIIGSYSNLIVSETYLDARWSFAVPGAEPIKVTTITNVLSADLVYTGYLRDVNGVGYENWARDGIAESDKIHGIYLTSYALQYNAPWILMRGSITSSNVYFGLLNVMKEVNADDRLLLPTSFTINDLTNVCNGEFLELSNITEGAGSGGGGGEPFSSGFSVGFGQSGFN